MRLLDDLLDRADRFQRGRPVLAFGVAVWKKFADDRAGDLAALVAYYTFVSIFPRCCSCWSRCLTSRSATTMLCASSFSAPRSARTR